MEVLKQIMEEKIVAIIRGLELEQTVRTAGALKEGASACRRFPSIRQSRWTTPPTRFAPWWKDTVRKVCASEPEQC